MLIILCVTAFSASLLTFFSGFGLGTILMPVFAMFVPLPMAVALTAIVHLANNIFKLFLTFRHLNKQVLLRFGVAAVLAAFLGAWCLRALSVPILLAHYTLAGRDYQITALKVVMAAVMILFVLFDIVPAFQKLWVRKHSLIWGGILSGFFGGLSGHQGALRSAFLSKEGSLNKESFIATGVTIACAVDVIRLAVYAQSYQWEQLREKGELLLLAIVAAWLGAWVGQRMLKKVTMESVQKLVSLMLIIFAFLLALGII
jgi:uncharacterized membrane protein YfcA